MTRDDKESAKVYLGAIDRSWIAGAMLTVVLAAAGWGYKMDSRQTEQGARQGDIERRQDEMLNAVEKLTDAIEKERSRSDQHFPQIDLRLREIEKGLSSLSDAVKRGG